MKHRRRFDRTGVISLGVAALLASSLFVAAAFATTPPSPERPATPAALSAGAWLDKAIEAQGGAALAGAIRDVTGRFEVISREDDGHLEVDTTQRYQREPDGTVRYLSSVRDRSMKRPSRKGFDGRTYWIEGEEGRARALRGKDDHVEKELIDADIDRVERLLELFFLKNLRGDDVELSVVEDHPLAPDDCVGLERRAPNESTAILFLDRRSAILHRAVIVPSRSGPTDENETRPGSAPDQPNDAKSVTGGTARGVDAPRSSEPAKATTDEARVIRYDFAEGSSAPVRCTDVWVGGRRDERLFIPRQILQYDGDGDGPVYDFWLNELRINDDLDPKTFEMPGHERRRSTRYR